MLANFDSTEQLDLWKRTVSGEELADAEGAGNSNGSSHASGSSINLIKLWTDLAQPGKYKRFMSTHPTIVPTFAGILRSAYLYSPKILLTVPQLFDGIFFTLLGPHTVLGLLGQSYKDAPSFIISGQYPTLEESFIQYFTEADQSHDKASGRLLHPLQYCIVDACIKGDDNRRCISLGSADAQGGSDADLSAEHDGHAAATIAAAFAEFWNGNIERGQSSVSSAKRDGLPAVSLSFLGQRWQEWIDAERNGLITYENQNDPAIANSFIAADFDEVFADTCCLHGRILEDWVGRQNESDETKGAFKTVLVDIEKKHKRSEAFSVLANVDEGLLPQYVGDNASSSNQKGSLTHSRSSEGAMRLDCTTLKNWYQFVYTTSMAKYLGCDLMVFGSHENSYEQYFNTTQPNKTLTFKGSITQDLGQMPYTRFSTFCYDARSTIANWRMCKPGNEKRKQKACAKNMAFCIRHANTEIDRGKSQGTLVVQMVIAVILAVSSAFFENVIFNGGFPVLAAVLIATFIAIIPNVLDVFLWVFDTHSVTQTIVV